MNLLKGSFAEFLQSEAALTYLTQKLKERVVLQPTAAESDSQEVSDDVV